MQKRWIYKNLPDQEKVQHLCTEINVSTPTASILLQRGICNYTDAKNFFRPTLDQLHDPFLMKDMDKAIDLLTKVLHAKEKILVYGDYDVDGTTSVALVYRYLSKITDSIEYYVPDRYTEGYGVSEQGIAYAAANHFNLIITLDCGIKAVNNIKKAVDLGIKVIVCDHHLPGAELPPAHAILDPKRNDCPYPYKELSGCGIGYKLIQAYQLKNKSAADPAELIDYVAVSIAADIVPITGENRTLAYYGIKKLADDPCPGLKALLDVSGSKNIPDVTDIVFGIAPRINAAGRIKHAKSAVELLVSQDLDSVKEFAANINVKNDDRRKVDAIITEEALAMIEADTKLQLAKSTVLFKNDWHKGVIGIVASRCIEKFYRPTIILTEHNNKATGSARSIPGFDLYKAIEECGDLLEQFGGHTHAAGLTLDVQNIPMFQERFERIVAENLPDDLLIPPVEIDIPLNFDQVTTNFFNILMQMMPFGPENFSPVFSATNINAQGVKILNEKHLKFTAQQSGQRKKFDSIAFNMTDKLEFLQNGTPFDMAFSLELNSYRGLRSIQLVVKDIKQSKIA
ncbi:MAG: single-stranded-DNA-specific exonuclease RecJ [Candidatus Cyclobacteriaceae bacterium M2_1C_046]